MNMGTISGQYLIDILIDNVRTLEKQCLIVTLNFFSRAHKYVGQQIKILEQKVLFRSFNIQKVFSSEVWVRTQPVYSTFHSQPFRDEGTLMYPREVYNKYYLNRLCSNWLKFQFDKRKKNFSSRKGFNDRFAPLIYIVFRLPGKRASAHRPASELRKACDLI